jgi:hypothetical protein
MNKYIVYVGWDRREAIAYDVARYSIFRHSSEPKKTQVIPLEIHNLSTILTRKIVVQPDGRLWCPISEAPMATEFAISRFIIPLLRNKGWALFVDCDVIFQSDITELFGMADEKYAVMVVKHNHAPITTTKMDGQIQTVYPRKNWSSVVLWNCGHASNRKLTSEVLNTWPGRDLHAFKWLDDSEIGDLPPEWNHLIGAIPDPVPSTGILHFTSGGPFTPGWTGGPLDERWNEALEAMRKKT